MTTPEGWRSIQLGDAVTMAVPADARDQGMRPIDSIFGVLRGDGYEVIYDYGRFGEDLAGYQAQTGYKRLNRKIDGRAASEVSVTTDSTPRGLVRILQVQDGAKVLTIRVSCDDDVTCRLATDLFDSVRFNSGD